MSGWDSLIGSMTAAYNSTAPEDSRVPTDSKDPWQRLLGNFSPRPSRSRPDRVTEEWIVEGLVERGMPQHIAKGFAMNMKDESGLDPGINERNPIVPGSRGGYGLYQLTGPRRRAYEAFAAERGVDVSDPNAQLDFLMYEVQGPEKSAYNAALNTNSAGEAAAVIVNRFLRPAEEHRNRRANKYLQVGPSPRVRQEDLQTTQPVMRGETPDFSKLWLTLGES